TTLMQFKFKVTDNSPFKNESNIANFNMNVTGDINVAPIYENLPPTVGNNTITIRYSDIRTLTQADFIEDTDPRFSDPEGDAPFELKVITLPLHGQLELNNIAVTVNQ